MSDAPPFPPVITIVPSFGVELDALAAVCREKVQAGHIVHLAEMDLDQASLASFTGMLGNIYLPAALPADKGLHEITQIEESEQLSSAVNWHYDQSFTTLPPDWSLRYCAEPGATSVPTVFCDASIVLSYLSEGLVSTLRDMKATHVAFYPEKGQSFDHPETGALHPCVLACAGGVEALFLAPATVDRFASWSRADSEPLLHHLFSLLNWPEVTGLHYWSRGDLLIWPNTRYPHRAMSLNPGSRRHLLRVVGHWR